MGANPLDHAGTEILLDTFESAGGNGFQLTGLELEAMGTVVVPYSDTLDVFAGGDGCRGADNGNQLPLAFDLGAEDTEAGFLAMEGDSFDGAGETFYGGVGILRLCFMV